MEWARSREWGVDAPGGYPVACNGSAAASTLSLDLAEKGYAKERLRDWGEAAAAAEGPGEFGRGRGPGKTVIGGGDGTVVT